MNKSWFYLGAVSSLAIFMTSCGGDGEKKPPTPAASPSAASPAPTVPTAAAPTPAISPSPTVPAVTPPMVPAKSLAVKPVSVDVIAGLIPPTDGDSWARSVAKGRPDPFAVLSLQPVEAALPKDLMGQTIQPQKTATAAAPKSKSSPSKTSTTANNSPAIKSGVNKPLPAIKIPDKIATAPSSVDNKIEPIKPDLGKVATVNPKPKISPTTKPSTKKDSPKVAVRIKPVTQPTLVIKPLPQPVALKPVPQPLKSSSGSNPATVTAQPEPKLAASVGVSGVIQVDGKTQVIVRLPNESFSRYVEVGDRIYDGKIKVKRVEGEQTLSPVVILEEVGVEVSRRVGDTAGAASPEAQAK